MKERCRPATFEEGTWLDLRAELQAAAQPPGGDSRRLYAALLASQLYVRAPLARRYAVSQPDTGRRALPAFLTAGEGASFWSQVAPGQPVALEPVDFPALAAEARQVGGLLVDPAGFALLLDRSELMQLAAGEIPGEFAAWLRGWGRLKQQPAEVLSRLRRTYVHVLTGRARGEGDSAPRIYLLEKSEDGTVAVPCFTTPETLAQFAQVRRLFEGDAGYAVALVDGEYVLRAANGLGAYLLIDPESPWETQLAPMML